MRLKQWFLALNYQLALIHEGNIKSSWLSASAMLARYVVLVVWLSNDRCLLTGNFCLSALLTSMPEYRQGMLIRVFIHQRRRDWGFSCGKICFSR